MNSNYLDRWQSWRKIIPSLASEKGYRLRRLIYASPTIYVDLRSQCLCLVKCDQTDTLSGSHLSLLQTELEMGIMNENMAALKTSFAKEMSSTVGK
jgi:hypothetical protein